MTPEDRKELKTYFDEKFHGVDKRFDGIDHRLDGTDKRFDSIDRRLDGMDKRFDGIDQRLDGMDKRFDGVDKRFDGIDAHLDRQDAALEQTTMNLLLTIDAEGAKARRYAERLFAHVDAPLGAALKSPKTQDRPKRQASAPRRAK
jgi:hypothetical protein